MTMVFYATFHFTLTGAGMD